MNRDLNKYIEKVNFDKQYKKLIKRYKNKKIIIYGGGQLFRIINEKYDLSKLNIIGVCDRSFLPESPDKQFLGYNKICIKNLSEYDTDVVLTGTLEYIGLIDFLKKYIFRNKKIIIRPLIYMPVSIFLKEIFFGLDEDSMEREVE